MPAAPVLANWEMLGNLHTYERGFYVTIPHRESGAWPYPGLPWKLSATPGSIRMAGPDLGEHNRLVLSEFLKLSPREIDGLYESRVVADGPPPNLLQPPPGAR